MFKLNQPLLRLIGFNCTAHTQSLCVGARTPQLICGGFLKGKLNKKDRNRGLGSNTFKRLSILQTSLKLNMEHLKLSEFNSNNEH